MSERDVGCDQVQVENFKGIDGLLVHLAENLRVHVGVCLLLQEAGLICYFNLGVDFIPCRTKKRWFFNEEALT